MRHQIPDGDLGAIVDRALTALFRDVTKQKFAAIDRPRGSRGTAPGSRHIPAEVRRTVWLRAGGRCAFVIQLRCRAHNGYEAEWYFRGAHLLGCAGRTGGP